MRVKLASPRKSGIEQTGPMRFKAAGTDWSFDPATGRLLRCAVDGKETGLGNGPVLYAGTEKGAISNEGAWQVETNGKTKPLSSHPVSLRADPALAGPSILMDVHSWTMRLLHG
jgi:hypothetical protein